MKSVVAALLFSFFVTSTSAQTEEKVVTMSFERFAEDYVYGGSKDSYRLYQAAPQGPNVLLAASRYPVGFVQTDPKRPFHPVYHIERDGRGKEWRFRILGEGQEGFVTLLIAENAVDMNVVIPGDPHDYDASPVRTLKLKKVSGSLVPDEITVYNDWVNRGAWTLDDLTYVVQSRPYGDKPDHRCLVWKGDKLLRIEKAELKTAIPVEGSYYLLPGGKRLYPFKNDLVEGNRHQQLVRITYHFYLERLDRSGEKAKSRDL